jgi:hypothetical protein
MMQIASMRAALKPMSAVLAGATMVALASASAASAQAGMPARALGEFAPAQIVPVEDLYPWNDLRWRRRLYGIPYPYPYFYQHVCGVEREPYGVGRKIRWRRVFRCH